MNSLDRRIVLKLLGAGTGAIALGGTSMPGHAAVAADAAAPASAAGRTLSEKIADYIVGARFEDLPPTVIKKAKEVIVFFFGRAFEISLTDQGGRMLQVARQIARASDGATVIGHRLRLAPSDAALANGTFFGGELGLDDVLADSDIHAGAITLPAALAIGEVKRVSGRDLLLALVLGYEVLGKLGRAKLAWTAALPRRSTNVYGGYGPVTAAGRLLKLDRERMASALGYAAHLCMGLPEGGMMEHYYGMVSRNGTFAAQLAEAGGIAFSRTTIEGELGLYRSFFGKVPEELPKLIDSLGYSEILTAVQKRYRGTASNITTIELFADMVRKNQLTLDKVSSIQAAVPTKGAQERTSEISSRGPFAPARRAAMSLPYGLALVLLDGKPDPKRFADDGIVNDPVIASVMQKINIAFEGGHGNRWTRLTVHTSDGRKLERESEFFTFDFPRDEWGDWLSASGKRLLSPPQLVRLEQLISNLEDVDDVSALLEAATPATGENQL